MSKIGLGGSCHWCTEAVFRSLRGVADVEQGWLAAQDADAVQGIEADPATGSTVNGALVAAGFSEGVIVHFDESRLPLALLVEIHLHSHSATNPHALRHRYRSALYCFDEEQRHRVAEMLTGLQSHFSEPLLTEALRYRDFSPSRPGIRDYYYRQPDKPFCQISIQPKLRALLADYGDWVDAAQRRTILEAETELAPPSGEGGIRADHR